MKRYLAKNHRFYIQDSQSWIQISGVARWSVSYESTVADLDKFNSNGWGGSIVTSRSGNIRLDGFYLADAVTGARDVGQSLCDLACNGLGFHGLRGFKIEAYDDNLAATGAITGSGIFAAIPNGGITSTTLPWGIQIELKGIPVGSGIYNIFDQETYPPPASGIDRAGMWTGVLGMYTYAE